MSFDTTKVYKAGTLQYTLSGLVVLFIWLIFGEFCWFMLEVVIPRLFPFLLKELKASNLTISFMVSSVPAILNITVIPALCVRSDRCRSTLGRRIPFLLITAPPLTLFMILIAYSNDIGRFAFDKFFSDYPLITQGGFLIAVMCMLMILFHIFNTSLNVIYKCLYVDVVPTEVMGRFLSLTRAVSTFASFIFSRYIFSLHEKYMREILIIIGIIHLAAFIVLCVGVKEGKYPDIEPIKKKNRFDGVKIYMRECFTHPIYLYFFLSNMFVALTWCMMPLYLFFYTEDLGMTMDELGKYIGWAYLVMAVCSVPAGYLVDKVNVIRITYISLLLICLSHLVSFFIYDKTIFIVVGLISTVPSAIYGISSVAMGVQLLPKKKYAQFISAMQMVMGIGMIAGNFVAGPLFDFLGSYRYIMLWYTVFEILAAAMVMLVLRQWIVNGGQSGYAAPESDSSADISCN